MDWYKTKDFTPHSDRTLIFEDMDSVLYAGHYDGVEFFANVGNDDVNVIEEVEQWSYV
jgi:hypothetical protein